jgi:redox-sensing transcriptional repressor
MALNDQARLGRIPIASEDDVPEVVVQRLPLYVRVLTQFERAGIEVISSEQLGAHLQMTPAQIRKDLSYFGRFGKQGRGYDVRNLGTELRAILGLNASWSALVVGLGRLGRAVVAYPGFGPEGFKITAAFDEDERMIGHEVGGLRVQGMSEIEKTVADRDIRIGIVAVPASQAQAVIDVLVKAEIKAILNYAPIAPLVPADVKVRGIDPVLALQSMTYYLKHPSRR